MARTNVYEYSCLTTVNIVVRDGWFMMAGTSRQVEKTRKALKAELKQAIIEDEERKAKEAAAAAKAAKKKKKSKKT